MQARGYTPGQRVYGALDNLPGTVVSVDPERGTFAVHWDGNDFPVVYPADSIMVREGWPWET
jgi:hypothetical protein